MIKKIGRIMQSRNATPAETIAAYCNADSRIERINKIEEKSQEYSTILRYIDKIEEALTRSNKDNFTKKEIMLFLNQAFKSLGE